MRLYGIGVTLPDGKPLHSTQLWTSEAAAKRQWNAWAEEVKALGHKLFVDRYVFFHEVDDGEVHAALRRVPDGE